MNPINFQANSSNAEWLTLSAPKTPIWVCNTESPVFRVVKNILSVVIFPIGLAQLLHRVIGNFVVPGALMTKGYAVLSHVSKVPLLGIKATAAKQRIDQDLLNDLNKNQEQWNIQRVSIRVDGRTVDAAIVTKKDRSKVQDKRWTLLSGGNGEFFQCLGHLGMVDALQSDAVYYNYPGVAGSTGEPSRSTIAKTSRVMLRFLEEQCQAKEIIWYGHSLGGGAQEAFADHTLKGDVRYCLIKSRTFSHLRKVVQDMFGGYRLVSFLVWLFGWDMSPVASVKNSRVPQIILQSRLGEYYESDDIITEAASFAKAVENDENPKCNGLFIPEMHNDVLGENTLENLKGLVQQAGFAMQATT